jgi:NAD(P)-dependent dehydrogenase (short-subunit alcohol dehydrogenase family)
MLDGKIAVVTGAGRGIGRGEALELARYGAKVVVNDPGVEVSGEGQDRSVAEQVAKQIVAAGGEAVHHTEDVSTFDGAHSLVHTAIDTWGGIDVVVNNAGILRDKMIFNMTEDDWDAVIRVHMKHTFAVTHHASVWWRERAKAGQPVAGRVINTTSGSGLLGNPGQANYGAAKAGIAAFTVIVAQELYRYGVTVNAVSPAARTRMTETIGAAAPPQEGFDRMSPENIAPLVAYLASDDAQWITGQVFRIAGGSLGLYKGWQIVQSVDKEERFEAAELPLLMRRIFGAYPSGLRINVR